MLAALLAVASPAGAETVVGGPIRSSTTWTLAGSPYVLTYNLSVEGPERPVLTIEPGVVVKVAFAQLITIGQWDAGELRAIGTAEMPIVFTTVGEVTTGVWRGMWFAPKSGGSRMENVVVEGSGYAGAFGLQVTGSAPILAGVTIRKCLYRGISVEAGGAPELSGCTVSGISSGDGAGIYVASGARLTVSDSVITFCQRGAITVEPGSELNGLNGMVLSGNGEDGIRHRGGTLPANETWRGFGYPYYLVDGRLHVAGAGAPVLTVEPGVVVKVRDGNAITIGEGAPGELHAIGTAEKPVVFTTVGEVLAGKWTGLRFGPGSGGSRLGHTVVEGGGYAAAAGITVTGSAPVLKDVKVQKTFNRGVSVGVGGSPEITGSLITGTIGGDGTGIYVVSGGRLTLSDSRITASSKGAITVEPGAELNGLGGLVLSGNGEDGVRYQGWKIVKNETWWNFGYPYFLPSSSLEVEGPERPILTIEPGVVVKVGDGREISIGMRAAGELRAVGTKESPVVFTTAAPLAAGSWQGIVFGPESAGSRLEHAVVEGGGVAGTAGIRVSGSAPVLNDVAVRSNLNRGIYVGPGSAPEITGCSLSGTTGEDGTGLHLAAGSAARVALSVIAGNSGAGIVNEGSRSFLRFTTLSGNGREGLRNVSGALALQDGTVSGQGVPVRNADPGAQVVDARRQWWSGATGPEGLVGRVEYEPWLGSAPTPGFAISGLEVSTRAFAPGSSSARFDVGLAAPGRWTLLVFSPEGSEVRRFEGAGTNAAVRFDGTDEAGALLAGGAASYRLEAIEESTGRVAAPLLGNLVLDAALPVAVLASPAGIARARAGEELLVEGSATGPGFESYLLEFGAGDFPSAWKVVDRGALPVVSGRLGTFTTALLATGRYALRLSVTGAAGKVAVATSWIDLEDGEECR